MRRHDRPTGWKSVPRGFEPGFNAHPAGVAGWAGSVPRIVRIADNDPRTIQACKLNRFFLLVKIIAGKQIVCKIIITINGLKVVFSCFGASIPWFVLALVFNRPSVPAALEDLLPGLVGQGGIKDNPAFGAAEGLWAL